MFLSSILPFLTSSRFLFPLMVILHRTFHIFSNALMILNFLPLMLNLIFDYFGSLLTNDMFNAWIKTPFYQCHQVTDYLHASTHVEEGYGFDGVCSSAAWRHHPNSLGCPSQLRHFAYNVPGHSMILDIRISLLYSWLLFSPSNVFWYWRPFEVGILVFLSAFEFLFVFPSKRNFF